MFRVFLGISTDPQPKTKQHHQASAVLRVSGLIWALVLSVLTAVWDPNQDPLPLASGLDQATPHCAR